jgi:ZIP family zinc transporter
MPLPYLLGIVAGGTIFLGFPIVAWSGTGPKLRGFFNAVSTGILLFILVEIVEKVIDPIEDLFAAHAGGFNKLPDAFFYSGTFLGGLAIGLLGMALFEKFFLERSAASGEPRASGPTHIALMIASGIGLHNLTEGLAIAQSYGWGDRELAWTLAIGFALHNATEGFGIAAPLDRERRRDWKLLFGLGLLGGGPTLVGAVLGSFWQSHFFNTLSMALAAGAILYVVGELIHIGRNLKGHMVVEAGLITGFTVAFLTEMFIAWAS